MRTIRYFVLRDMTDKSVQLGRVIDDQLGLRGELLVDGKWTEEKVVTHCLMDPLFGEEIEEQDAAAMASHQGGSL